MSEEVKENQPTTPEEKAPEKAQEITQEPTAPDIKTEENKANWKKFREQREIERKALEEERRERKKKEEEAAALKAALEAIVNKPQPQPQYGYEEETEEARIEKKVQAALEKERVRYEEFLRQKEREELPRRLNQNFHDFNQVVNTENIDYLEYHHPEIAQAFRYMPEGYEKWSAVYKAVKKFVPLDKKEDERRIEQNMKKPQAMAHTMTDQAPQFSASKLTEERRMANWRRMRQDMKGI